MQYKLKYFQLKIPIDSSVESVCQTARLVSYHLRDKLSQKLNKLKELDSTRKTSGPTQWASLTCNYCTNVRWRYSYLC